MTVMDCDMVIYSPLWFFHGLFPPPRGQGSESSSLRSTSTAWAHSWPSSQVVHTALHSATSAAPMESADCSKPEKHGFLKEKLIELCRNKCQYADYTLGTLCKPSIMKRHVHLFQRSTSDFVTILTVTLRIHNTSPKLLPGGQWPVSIQQLVLSSQNSRGQMMFIATSPTFIPYLFT